MVCLVWYDRKNIMNVNISLIIILVIVIIAVVFIIICGGIVIHTTFYSIIVLHLMELLYFVLF